jgi:signal recognition particle subunit SEC65
MAIITGDFDSVAEAERAAAELELSGVARSAITITTSKDTTSQRRRSVSMTVAVDIDHAQRVTEIIKAYGHVSRLAQADVSYPDDRVSEQRRFVTENRDSSRDPYLDRDDVEIIEEALESHHPPVPHKPS